MINVTKHCMDRYAERVLGIEDSQTARQHINSNIEKITEDVNKLFEFATLVYTGQINGDKSTKNYWLRDNIVMVTDTGNSTLITLYRIDFGFGMELDKVITAKLLEEIEGLVEKRELKKQNIASEVEAKETEIDNIDASISQLEQAIGFFKLKKETLKNEIKIANQDVELVNKDIEVRALKICNSAEYRKDLLKLNVGK